MTYREPTAGTGGVFRFLDVEGNKVQADILGDTVVIRRDGDAPLGLRRLVLTRLFGELPSRARCRSRGRAGGLKRPATASRPVSISRAPVENESYGPEEADERSLTMNDPNNVNVPAFQPTDVLTTHDAEAARFRSEANAALVRPFPTAENIAAATSAFNRAAQEDALSAQLRRAQLDDLTARLGRGGR